MEYCKALLAGIAVSLAITAAAGGNYVTAAYWAAITTYWAVNIADGKRKNNRQ